MKASVIFNLLIAVCTAASVRSALKQGDVKTVMRYYTTLSNLLCAFAALLVMLYRLSGPVPNWVLILKHIGTVAVTVTLLVVFLYLGPVSQDLKGLLSGYSFFLHLFCPLLAIVSRIAWDRPRGGLGVVLLGVLPVLLYGMLYFQKVLMAPDPKRWDDFYGFNKGGKWPVSAASVIGGCFIVSLLLWLFG